MSELFAQARAALESGQHAKALEVLALFEQSNPLSLPHYRMRGFAQLGLSDWKGAAETFGEAVKRYRDNHELWAYLGLAQMNIREKEARAAAVVSFERSLQLNPNNGVAAANLSDMYRRLGRFVEAEALALTGVKHHPDKPWALNMLGLALGELGRFEDAKRIYLQVLKLDPNRYNALYNLANIEAGLQNFEAAWPLFKRAQANNPESQMRVGEGLARMLSGDYVKGWEMYEARREGFREGMHVLPSGQSYRGQPLAGKKIAIVVEQGYGDVLNFCRFGPLLVEQGAEIAWIIQKRLTRLFAASFPGRVFAIDEPLPEDFDYHLPIMSLPYFTKRMRPEDWPKPPYLVAPEGPELPPAEVPGPKVGLVWAGSPGHEKDFHRSMPLSALDPLFKEVKAQFYALFLSEKLNEITDQPIIRLDPLIKDFGDTAALMKQMDYIISVDTGPAHLAGALGLKMYLLINYIPEWRWGFSGKKTAWYPGATVLRQEAPGDWDSVVCQLIQRLKAR